MDKRVQKQYTNEDIRRAAVEFALKGKFSAVERSLNIPRQTLQSWAKNSEVWNTTLSETRHEKDQAPATNLTKPSDNTLEAGCLTGPGSKYTDEERRRAALEHGVYGNMAKVAKITGIPETTLFYWKNHSDWWDTLVVEVRGEKADEQRQGYSLIVDEAHKEILDRN